MDRNIDRKHLFDIELYFLSRLKGIDFPSELAKIQETNKFKGSLSKLDILEYCFTLVQIYKSGYEGIALYDLYQLVLESISAWTNNRLKDKDDIVEATNDISSTLGAIAQNAILVKECYDKDLEVFSNLFKEQFGKYQELLKDTEKMFKLKAYDEQTYYKFGFKLNRYTGTKPLAAIFEKKLLFHDTIVVLSEPDAALKSAVNLKSPVDRTVIYPFFVKSNIEAYSYFMFVIKCDDSIWLLNNCKRFANPDLIVSSRNPNRRFNNMSESVYAWYDMLLNEVDYNAVVPTNQEARMSVIKQVDHNMFEDKLIFERNMVTMFWFVEWFLRSNQDDDKHVVKIGTIYDTIKYLPSLEQDKIANNDKFDNLSDLFYYPNKDAMQKYLANYKFDLDSDFKALVKSTKEVALELADINNTKLYLYTEQAIKTNVEYLHRKQLADIRYERLRANKINDEAKLKQMIMASTNLRTIIEMLLTHTKLGITYEGLRIAQSFGSSVHRQPDDFDKPVFSVTDCCNTSDLFPHLYLPLHHNNERNNKLVHFVCHSYYDLMFLCGCTREELPLNFQNYLTFHCIPYYGNPILDNIDPCVRLACDEPMQNKYPNRFVVGLEIDNATYKELKTSKKTKELWIECDANAKIKDVTYYEPDYDYIKLA